MKIFNPINPEYVAPIDLNTYDKYRTTTHQGHLQAVQTASSIQAELAKLDLNEAEAGYRQELSNRIKSTLLENTTADNSFAALDNLILEQGNIFADQGLIGRLNAQKDYKAYLAKLDKANIPEEYKNYYRNNNKYYYNDKFDDNGNVIQGDAWKPQEDYVDSVDTHEVMRKALSTVMKSQGGNEIVNQDGQWLVKKGTTWQGISEDKVRAAIDAAFASTPGLQASLNQDYKIGVIEKYKDLLKQNSGEPFVQEGITDDKGNLLSRDRFVNSIIDNFVEGASGINYTYNVDYQHIPQYSGSTKGNGSGSDLTASDYNAARSEALSNATIPGTADLATNTFNNNSKEIAATSQTFNSLISKPGTITGKTGGTLTPGSLMKFVKSRNGGQSVTGPGDALNQFFRMTNPNTGRAYSDDYTNAEKVMLYKAIDNYSRAMYDRKELQTVLSPMSKEAVKFKNSLDSGSFDINNSIFDKQIIASNNTLFAHGDVSYTVPADVYQEFIRLNNGNIPNYIVSQDNGDGTYQVTLPEANRNASPEFAYNLLTANDNTTSWLNPMNWVTALSGRKHFQFDYVNNNNLSGADVIGKYGMLERLANTYKQGIQQSQTAIREYNKTVNTKVDLKSTMFPTETAAVNEYLMKYGKIDRVDAEAMNKRADANLRNAFANNAFNLGRMYEIKDFGEKAGVNYTEVQDPHKLQALISYMYSNNKQTSQQYGTFNGVIDEDGSSPSGYFISFTVPDDYKESSLRNKQIRLFVSGTNIEGTNYNIGKTTAQRAENSITIAKTTGRPYSIINYNNYLGDTHIQALQNGQYEVNFMGNKQIVSEPEAESFANALNTLRDVKLQAISGSPVELVNKVLNDSGIYYVLSYALFNNGNYTDYIATKIIPYLYDTNIE